MLQETINKNKLISVIMDVKYLDLGDIYETKDGEILGNENDLMYHKSWDWLMPVVEKIIELGADIIISGDSTSIVKGGTYDSSGDLNFNTADFETEKYEGTMLENTYNAIIEFINWYNQKTTK